MKMRVCLAKGPYFQGQRKMTVQVLNLPCYSTKF